MLPNNIDDTTQHKEGQMQREQFYNFFNLAVDFQCMVGLDGYFKHVNSAFTEILGYSKQELLTTPLINFILPEDRAATMQQIVNLQAGQQLLDFENRYLAKNGAIHWLSWRANLNPTDNLIYAIGRNVTETKKNQERLVLADLVYQHSIEGILITDADYNIISVNPAFTAITGYTEAESVGKNIKAFKSGQHAELHDEAFYKNMWSAVRETGQWQGELWGLRKNGEIYARFLSINEVRYQDGEVTRSVGIFTDITERKKLEQEIKRLSDSELNKAKQEAEKANRAKSDFLSSMSHELRTPMNAVLGFAQLLEDEDLTEDQLDSVREILTAGQHLMELINQVLDLSKIESENLDVVLEKVDLTTLLQNCLTLVQPLIAKRNINIIDNIEPLYRFTLLADPLRFKQVLLNLISNAIKYNRPNGSITLSCELSNVNIVKIKVTDTGKGLSEEQLGKLFVPFERLSAKNSNIEGSGIGLVISKKLIEAMHGNIGVESTEGVGSCFWIEIPLA